MLSDVLGLCSGLFEGGQEYLYNLLYIKWFHLVLEINVDMF